MPIFTDKIKKIMKEKNLTLYELGKQIDFSDGALCTMMQGKCPFSEKAVNKLLPILEISKEEFESWIVADKYSKDLLIQAFKAKKDFPFKRKSILTTKIDSILQTKGMSRTTLAKQINYSQSGLNRMIIGQISMSKSVIERISNILDIPEADLRSWIVADKYSLHVLKLAVDKNNLGLI